MNMFTLQTLAAKAEQSGEDLGGFMSPERLEIAGQVVLIGMGMVFAVLRCCGVCLPFSAR